MKIRWLPFATASLLLAGIASCGAAPSLDGQTESAIVSEADSAEPAGQTVSDESAPSSPSQTARPQLIKRAYLSIGVDTVDDSYDQVRQIIEQQQGDLLSLNDTGDRQRMLRFELRVPQERLDATLEALAGLGTIQDRSITTEDVSSQLVDLDARIKNARESEAALQEIVQRSGEISDVLEVSRELSSVRQNIEQMTALEQSLKTQVRYSTISLTIESAIPVAANQPGVSRQLSNTWQSATQSVGNFSTGLLKLCLWLLVYSPYVAIALLGGVFLRSRIRRNRPDQPS